jgi:hypothetical protein
MTFSSDLRAEVRELFLDAQAPVVEDLKNRGWALMQIRTEIMRGRDTRGRKTPKGVARVARYRAQELEKNRADPERRREINRRSWAKRRETVNATRRKG